MNLGVWELNERFESGFWLDGFLMDVPPGRGSHGGLEKLGDPFNRVSITCENGRFDV